jgi:hypothetical protein
LSGAQPYLYPQPPNGQPIYQASLLVGAPLPVQQEPPINPCLV